MLASGTTVGRYVVLDQLGEGAMGEVYRAWDNALDRVVALKLMLPLRAESSQARKRFQRESRLSARINHPSVAHVYDVGSFEDSPFIAMEFVPGKQLRAEMGAPIPVPRVVFLARQILEGLTEAHRQGVVHRDLKPENILISGRDQVKILDFGLAKPIFDDASEATPLTTTGLTGTPRYMAPEQIQGAKIDVRTDIYALGTVLYEMITGAPAHRGKTLGELLMAVVQKPVPRLTEDLAPGALIELVHKALQKQPQQRFPSAEAMLFALSALIPAGAPSLDGPTGPVPIPEGLRAVGSASEDPSIDEYLPNNRAVKYARRGREALTGISSTSTMAIELLEEAIAIDPHYAVAHALYGEACAVLFNTGHRDATWLDRAQDALERAEALDPNLPDLRVTRARIMWTKTFNFPAETALRELRIALKAEPNHTGALRLWATITAHVGLVEQATVAIAKRMSADPHDETMSGISAGLYMAEGQYDRALEVVERFVRLDPNCEEGLFWWIKGHALALAGRMKEAIDILKTGLRRHPEDPLFLSLGALIKAAMKDTEGSRELTRRAEASFKSELHPHHAYFLLACAESVLGDIPQAMHWLARTADEGLPCYPWFAHDPTLENLRTHEDGARYMAELKRRHEFFKREFPLTDPATMSFVATEVTD